VPLLSPSATEVRAAAVAAADGLLLVVIVMRLNFTCTS